MKRELEAVIDELLAGKLSSGRRYEKLNAGDNLYSAILCASIGRIALYFCSTRISALLSPLPSVPMTRLTAKP